MMGKGKLRDAQKSEGWKIGSAAGGIRIEPGCQTFARRMLGKPYLGITSGLPVIREELVGAESQKASAVPTSRYRSGNSRG